MPAAATALDRRTLSSQLELPPSMTTSPAASRSVSSATVVSVGSPDGTITHTTRGVSSAATRSASDPTSEAALKAS
jgi:hypothetical protein